MTSQIWNSAYLTTVPYPLWEMRFLNILQEWEQLHQYPHLHPELKEGHMHLHTTDPTHNRGKAKIIDSFAGIADPLKSQHKEKESSKGGKKKTSQGAQAKTQPQPITNSYTSSKKHQYR